MDEIKNEVMEICSNQSFWNFLTILSSFLIAFITLKVDAKSNKDAMKSQREQWEKEMESERQRHIETMNIAKEQARAELLPYLFLNQQIQLNKTNEGWIFVLEIKNIGNSGAFDVKIETQSLENKLPYAACEDLVETQYYYQYTGYLFEHAIPVNQTGNFQFLLDICNNNHHYQKSEAPIAGQIRFFITFRDALYNLYRQEYLIQYSTTLGCGRVESYLPVQQK